MQQLNFSKMYYVKVPVICNIMSSTFHVDTQKNKDKMSSTISMFYEQHYSNPLFEVEFIKVHIYFFLFQMKLSWHVEYYACLK